MFENKNTFWAIQSIVLIISILVLTITIILKRKTRFEIILLNVSVMIINLILLLYSIVQLKKYSSYKDNDEIKKASMENCTVCIILSLLIFLIYIYPFFTIIANIPRKTRKISEQRTQSGLSGFDIPHRRISDEDIGRYLEE